MNEAQKVSAVDGYEPGGVYLDANDTPWRRTGDGRWIVFGYEGAYPDNAPSRPLRKLVPEACP